MASSVAQVRQSDVVWGGSPSKFLAKCKFPGYGSASFQDFLWPCSLARESNVPAVTWDFFPRRAPSSLDLILNVYPESFDDFWIAWYTFAISVALAEQHGSGSLQVVAG